MNLLAGVAKQLGIHLRQRRHIYLVAAQRKLALAVVFHRRDTLHHFAENIFAITKLCTIRVWRLAAGNDSRAAGSQKRFSHQPLRDQAIQINRLRKLLLLDILAIRMRHVNRSRPNQHRLPPISE